MPKRKRNAELSLPERLEKHEDEIFRALKAAKGFERQRLAKRSRDDGVTPDKQERLEREITVLKSLDLHQTARAHLSYSLLKVKSIATSTDLPQELRRGVSKPDLPDAEKTALHNVTSGLYNRKPVKDAVDRAIEFVCEFLNVPAPGKGKPAKKDKRKDQEDQPADRIQKKEKAATDAETAADGDVAEYDDETDFEGFQSDVDEPGPAVGETVSGDEGGEDEEKEFTKLDDLLGSSSEEEDWADSKYDRYRGTEQVNLDDISDSGGSGPEISDDDEEEETEEGEEEEEESDEVEQIDEASDSEASISPPPEKKKKKAKKDPQAAAPARDSTFLPSLMGGYISGSESASDIDIAPPKKRRGQRARQAIAEQKFGAKAKHLQKEQKGKGKGRDAGWDMRRGAVDGEDQARRTPWKKGVGNPFAPGGGKRSDTQGGAPAREAKPNKRDDTGVLHPSWQAAKAKESQKNASFSGQKITFD